MLLSDSPVGFLKLQPIHNGKRGKSVYILTLQDYIIFNYFRQ